ncbi:MAG: chloride channel protein, partial [Desulfoplanes sp.]
MPEQNAPATFSMVSKWTLYCVGIGLVAGIGAIVFHFLCDVGFHFFMHQLAGYHPPSPAGEHSLFEDPETELVRYMLLILPCIGGLVSGFLVYTFAPEAEGHGTDAAIDAYHNKGGLIRARVPFIKTLASVITLTSGGSGGREGPIAQIGAGFGSFLATKLKLSRRERRIMLAAGMGAGIGAIFRAPLAGALFSAEVLYKDPDIEPEVLIPSGMASVVAYCTFCAVFGWGSLFHSPDFTFSDPVELIPYILLAFVVTGFGWLYVRFFYGITGLFRKWKIPNHIKPAIGGLITGMIGFFLPQTLSFGYGYMQQAINNELSIMFLLALCLGKILTTSFTIGSGGSGGVFGPSVVIGGAVGGVVGNLANVCIPGLVGNPGSFVVVGMAGFFTSVSNTPISTIIFISEMTNSYHLLLPSLLVCSISYMISKKWTIYVKQVQSKIDSPAHAGDFFVDVLERIRVRDLKDRLVQPTMVRNDMPLSR